MGIKTDTRLMTNMPHVYALGDCVEFDGQLQPYIAPIYWGIQALSQTLTGVLYRGKLSTNDRGG